MLIGNVVTNSKVNVPAELNVVESIDEIISTLPTLIVGWDYIEKNYPDYNILDRTLSNGFKWTFKRKEKRDLHEEDMLSFITFCYQELIRPIKYQFIDPILFSNRIIRKVIRTFYSFDKIYTYFENDMYYIYSNNLIMGLDIFLLKYMHLNYTKIIDKIKEKSTVVLTVDAKKDYEHNLNIINNSIKYIPFFYSLDHP